ncbi:UNKNOWN [Stylonychia lemnae]|uniref:Uncharacterized protein n=1 Tax=Stylonychia lemnae TaxID=5949 RepID=A0A078AJZ0_STYLE|nr:UNKNOWN [Stylonychia lemnae]|eukprot:CDW81777.1 UNKNOWN [Stylonychia lemnae]
MNHNQFQRHDLIGADIFQNEPENNIRYIDNGREVEIKQNAPMLRKFVLQQLQENNIDQSCRSQQVLGEKIQMALLTYIEKYPDYFKKNYSYVLFNLGRVNTAEQSLKIQQQLCQLLEDKDCFGSINYYNERLTGLLVMELNVQKILQEFTVNNFEQQAQFDKVFEEDIEQRIKQKWVRCERFLMFYN